MRAQSTRASGARRRIPAAVIPAIALPIAIGIGVVLVPMSIARAESRRDLVHRPVTDLPETRIALAWLNTADSSAIEEFVGIVRGRTAHSSRTNPTEPTPKPKAEKKKLTPEQLNRLVLRNRDRSSFRRKRGR